MMMINIANIPREMIDNKHFYTKDIEMYLAKNSEIMASIKNVTINGRNAQKVDFCKIEAEGTTHYYIKIVIREGHSDYYNKKLWLEATFKTTKEDGNKIYIKLKATRKLDNVDLDF